MLKVPLKKIDRDNKTAMFFLLLLFCGIIINALTILPMFDNLTVVIIYA